MLIKQKTFGIKSATGIFQRAIENKRKGLKHTVVRVDDILVGRKNDQEKCIYCVEGERFEA